MAPPRAAPFCVSREAFVRGFETETKPGIPPASSGAFDFSELAADLFDTLRGMSFDGVGISRETYGPGETAAMELVERLAKSHGFETSWDAARNLLVRLPGTAPELPV